VFIYVSLEKPVHLFADIFKAYLEQSFVVFGLLGYFHGVVVAAWMPSGVPKTFDKTHDAYVIPKS